MFAFLSFSSIAFAYGDSVYGGGSYGSAVSTAVHNPNSGGPINLESNLKKVAVNTVENKVDESTTSGGGSMSCQNFSSSKSLKLAMKGTEVKNLQTCLKLRNYLPASSKVDGIFGKKTKAAVIKFQKDNKIKTNGIVGPQTKAKLKTK